MNTITTEELRELREQNRNLALVNTLNTDSFEKTKISGAVNIPLSDSDFVGRVAKLAGGQDKPVVVYCASDKCDSSAKAAERLEKAGFTAVSRYTGGTAAWQKEAEEANVGPAC